jgi:GTPase SAR1 family protein
MNYDSDVKLIKLLPYCLLISLLIFCLFLHGEVRCCTFSYKQNGRTDLIGLGQALQEQPHLQHPDSRPRQRRQDHPAVPDVPFRSCRSLGKAVETTPTIGSNVEEITHKNIKLSAWDLGGQERIRSIWSTYYTRTDAVIFVIDSTDLKG